MTERANTEDESKAIHTLRRRARDRAYALYGEDWQQRVPELFGCFWDAEMLPRERAVIDRLLQTH